MDRAQVVTAVLLLVGVLGTGLGAYHYTTTSSCHPYYLTVSENPSGYQDAPVHEFSALTDAQQRAFTRALDTPEDQYGTHRLPMDAPVFDQIVKVDYQGQRYLVTTLSSDGCLEFIHELTRILPLGLGVVSLAAGGFRVWESRS